LEYTLELLLLLLFQFVVELPVAAVPLVVALLRKDDEDEPGAHRVHTIGKEELTAVKEPAAHGRHTLVLVLLLLSSSR
jgi:hypothetical protein